MGSPFCRRLHDDSEHLESAAGSLFSEGSMVAASRVKLHGSFTPQPKDVTEQKPPRQLPEAPRINFSPISDHAVVLRLYLPPQGTLASCAAVTPAAANLGTTHIDDANGSSSRRDGPPLSPPSTPPPPPSLSFLQSVPLHVPRIRDDWTYDSRHQAQQILPFLYVGPLSVAKDGAFLRRERITLLYGISFKHSLYARIIANVLAQAHAGHPEIATASLGLGDGMDTIASLPEAARVINTHLWDVRRRYDSAWSFLDTVAQAGHCAGDVNYGAVAEEARLMPPMGKVLLFCESGNERCCTVAAGWLMQHVADVDFTRAMQIVASQRYCANFDDATRNMLRSFWDIIKARRAVLGEMVVKEWGQRLQEGGVDEGGEVKMELGVEPGHAVKSTKDGKPSAPVQKRKAHQTMDDQDMADDDLARFQDRNLNFEEDADMPFS